MKGKKSFMLNKEMYIHEARVEEDQNKKQLEKEREDMAKIEAFRKFAGKVDFLAK